MSCITHYYGSNRGFVKHHKHYLEQVLFGSFSKFKNVPNTVDRVVFVCKGNICRSPLAEKVFQSVSSIDTASFGLDTHSGYPAHPLIVKVSKQRGYHLLNHKTTSLEHFEPEENDLYVCTEPHHASLLKRVFKSPSVLLLGFFGSKIRIYIHDPYSAPEEYVNTIVDYIIDATKKLSQETGNVNSANRNAASHRV